MEENHDIKEELRKYHISYRNLLPYLNLKHVQRVYEELSTKLTEEKKQQYLSAIEKIKEERIKFYSN